MDDLVEAKVGVQVLLPYSVMLSEEPFDARAEMVDRAEPGFLLRYLRVHRIRPEFPYSRAGSHG